MRAKKPKSDTLGILKSCLRLICNKYKDEYQQRSGTVNLGEEYEHLIPALFALRTTCRSDIVDMWLASNAEGMGAFDDVIFYVEFQGGQKKAYVVQLKHKGTPITAASFDKDSDDYNISKYQKSFEMIMQNNSDAMLENVAAEDINFIVYTTADLAPTIDAKIMKKLNLVLHKFDVEEKEFSLLNTSSSNDCVYKFQMDDKNKVSHNEAFLSQYYFYIKQGQAGLIENLIQQIIRENFANSDANVKLNLLNFIKMWVRGYLGGHYKLRKNEFQLKLTELLLNAYLLVPKTLTPFKKADLWNEVVKSAEVTIVENYTENMAPMLWTAINSILYKYTDRKLRENMSWDNSIEITLNDLPKKYKKQVLHVLTMKQVGNDRELTMKCLYIVLWKAGLLPLLVKAEDIEEAKNIFAAISISIEQAVNRHVILLFKGEDNTLNNYCAHKSVLRNLADVQDLSLVQRILDNLEISLQARKPILLSKIIKNDHAAINNITIELMLKMFYQPLIIGQKHEDLPENYIKRRVSKILLNREVLKASDEAFIVNGPGDIVDDIKSITDHWRVIGGKNYKHIGSTEEDKYTNIVALEETEELTLKEKQHLATGKNGIHYLRYCDGNLEWLRSSGYVENIKQYVVNVSRSEQSVEEENVWDNFSEKINIISSNPGMGKSVMIKRLSGTCMGDFWVIPIILNNHHVYFKQQQKPVVNDFSDTGFHEGTSSVYESFATSIISTLMKLEKVVVLMDAFDEISTECMNPVIGLAKSILKLGYRLWITTRPVHSAYLEKKLNTFSISLIPFSAEDQKLFLTKYLYEKKKQNVGTFVEKLQNLMSKSFSNWDTEFLGVPLHLQMVVEIFEEKSVADINMFHQLSTVDLYEAFIDNKLDVYWKKMFGDNINGLNEKIYAKLLKQLKFQHAKASLLLFFPKPVLMQILDFMDIENFLKDTATGDVGLIISGSDWEQPIFTHRTFAEFLAAMFLATSYQKKQIKPLLVALFNEELTVIRKLFDRMLAKGRPLHLAILNNNLEDVSDLIEKRKGNSELDFDLGGRTPLHLAAAWGSRHTFPNTNKLFNSFTAPDLYKYVSLEESDHRVYLVDSKVLNILDIVLNIQEYENPVDSILGWRAIDYACRSYSLDVLEKMFSNNQHDNALEFFEKNSLVYYCVRNCYKNILSRITIDNRSMIIDQGRKNLFHIAVKDPDILEILLHKSSPLTMKNYLNRKDYKGDRPLMYGAKTGNMKVFKILLNCKVDLNVNNLYGLTVLHVLVFFDHLECLKLLVSDSSIDLNARTAAYRKRDYTFKNPGHTALYFAVNKNNVDMIKLLIEHGANVNLKYENNRTLMHVAAINGFLDAIQQLLKGGAEIQCADDSGRTPLHYAAQNMKINSMNLLLQLGVDVNKSDVFGRTPLHYAVQNFRLDQIEFPEEIDIDASKKDNLGRTILHYAAQKIKIEEKLKYLLPLGNDVNKWHNYGTAPANRATVDDRLSNIDFLIQFGANPNEGDETGRTPLHYAAEQGILENIECLIKLEADINKTDQIGQTPLFEAAQSGKLNVLKFLLEFSPDIDKYNRFKVGPIHVTAEKMYNKCARMLIGRGCNINSSTIDGCTALFIAVRKNNENLVELLIENRANVNKPSYDTFANGNSNCVAGKCDVDSNIKNMLSPLHVAIQLGNLKIITSLVDSKVKINQTDSNGWTALHFAAHLGRVECIDSLLNRGAGMHLQNQDGCTPLHLTAKQNHCKTLETLLRSRRSKAVNMPNNEELTPLHIICYHGCLTCVKTLIEKGADVNICTREGYTPLNLAVTQKHTEIQEYLEHLPDLD